MIRTSNILVSIEDVPETWIFEHYLSIPEKLDGREVKFKSVFNPTERTPSMFVYSPGNGKYKFKDFSTGLQGNGIELVSKLFDLTYSKAVMKIKNDYAEWLKTGSYVKSETKEHCKFKVTDYNGRKWSTLDAKYWTSFCIPSSTLEHYNVIPLENYTMNNGQEEIVISGHYIYGYLKKDGLLYKIYQPKSQSKKFLKVRNCIQGFEQLTYSKPNLVIHSSLKDLMSFQQLGFKTIECIAPDSENSMISEGVMWDLIDKYDNVITIFDNDEAGKKAVEKYKERYGITGFSIDLEKDVSDSIKRYGKEAVKAELVPLLIESIHTCRRCTETSTLV